MLSLHMNNIIRRFVVIVFSLGNEVEMAGSGCLSGYCFSSLSSIEAASPWLGSSSRHFLQ